MRLQARLFSSILALPLQKEALLYTAAAYGGRDRLIAVSAAAQASRSGNGGDTRDLAWWWDSPFARAHLQKSCTRLLTALTRRRGLPPLLAIVDFADIVAAQESLCVRLRPESRGIGSPDGLGLIPVVSLELSHAFALALFSARANCGARAAATSRSITQAADALLDELPGVLPTYAGVQAARSGGGNSGVRSPTRTCYAGLVYASLVASQARELLLQGGVAPPASDLPPGLAHLAAARSYYMRFRGESASPTDLGRLYMHTQGGDAFDAATTAIEEALVPLGFDIVQGRLPLAQLRVLSIPRTWQAFTRIMSAWGLGDALDSLGGGGEASGAVPDMLRDLEGATAALLELRAVALFLREAALASPSLLQLLSQFGSTEAIAVLPLSDTQEAIESFLLSFADVDAHVSVL